MDRKKILYLECETGISGDMAVGALLDLGADKEKLLNVLSGMEDHSFRVNIGRVNKAGIDCCDFDVILDAEHDGHDHDMEYLYGHLHNSEEIHGRSRDDERRGHHHGGENDHQHGHDHDHQRDHGYDHQHEYHCGADGEEHDHQHGHDHGYDHQHEYHCGPDGEEHGQQCGHGHHHHHTSLEDVQKIIAGLDMTEGARALALRIFDIVARAESKAHGVPVGQVHFHEVGAVDSIVDIVSAAVCFDDLQIGEVIIPEITEGSGTVRCQHGILPVPVPAVANIAASAGLPLRISSRQGELVTPTGAAFAAAVMTGNILPDIFRVKKIGMGAGKRAYEIPSILRAMIIEPADRTVGRGIHVLPETADMLQDVPVTLSESADTARNLHTAAAGEDGADKIWKLECDVDDSTGEQLGYTIDRLYAAGAREAHYSPVFMKKNRPGWELTVLCSEADCQVLENVIFEETTTLGIRRSAMERSVLGRNFIKVKTVYGPVTVKISGAGKQRKVHPEYDEVSEAARKAGVPFRTVYNAAAEAARGQE